MSSRTAIATVSTTESAVCGLNHNVTRKGRRYHVQTEDSGRSNHRITTYLFSGGRVLAVSKSSYLELVGAQQPSGRVRQLVERQHKEMLRALVSGAYDDADGSDTNAVELNANESTGTIAGAVESSLEVPGAETQPVNDTALPLEEPSPPRGLQYLESISMANNVKESLAKLESTEGFIGAALVDSDSGMNLGTLGGGAILNLEVAGASNAEVVRAKRKAMKNLALRDDIEDILITLGRQYHLIRPLKARPNVFFYLALDRARSNLALARMTLGEVEKDIVL